MHYAHLVDAAGLRLKNSELGRMPHLTADWNAIHWKTSDSETGAEAQVVLSQPDTIILYPLLERRSALWQQAALLREFGISVFTRHASEMAQRTWEEKLCLPFATQIDAVQERLKNLETYPTYEALVESFDRCMDRYVALNLCNALLRPQRVPREDAVNLNLREWGSTLEYACLKRTHRIVPFVHAYANRQVAECPGVALAEWLVNELRAIRESSVATALKQVLVETYSLCR